MTCIRCHPSANCTRYAFLLDCLNWSFWIFRSFLFYFFFIVSLIKHNVQWPERNGKKKGSLFTCTWINWRARVIFGNECVINRMRVSGSLWLNINNIVDINTSSQMISSVEWTLKNPQIYCKITTIMCEITHFKHIHFIKFHLILHVPHN